MDNWELYYQLHHSDTVGTKAVTGVPPLTFKSNGRPLKNYRIYGNTVDGESVGDLVTEGEHAEEYCVPVMTTNGTDTQTTNIYLPEPLRTVGSEAEYVDYKEQKQHRVRKNLAQTIATSKTINDITFIVNANGSVTCNGTNHGNNPIMFELNNPDVVFPEGVYITSGCPAGGSITGGYKIQYFNGSGWNYELGSGSTFTLSGNLKYRSRILISKDVTVTNLTFYPMLRLAFIEDDTYEPYIEDTDLDVTLPALPTLSGTNTLTVNTTVQPSLVSVTTSGAVPEGLIKYLEYEYKVARNKED